MSMVAPLRQIAALVAGRWQLPLALCAAVSGGYVLYRATPGRLTVNLDSVLADVATLERAGRYVDAADALANLIEFQPPLPPAQRAILHDCLAAVVYRQEQGRPTPSRANAQLIVEHQREALALGLPVASDIVFRLAQAYDWLGETDKAAASFRIVLAQSPAGDDRRHAARSLTRILAVSPAAADERRSLLLSLLDDEAVSLDTLWWALRELLRDAFNQDDVATARRLLEVHGAPLRTSDLKGYYNYLDTWVLIHERRLGEALPLTRWIADWWATRPPTASSLDPDGLLPFMNRWLIGRIAFAEGRPQEALREFDAALQPVGTDHVIPVALRGLFVAASIGRGEALGALGRHAAARETFRGIVQRLAGAGEPADIPTLASIRLALVSRYEECWTTRDYESAAAYLSLAVELTPPTESTARLELLAKLGQTLAAGAEHSTDPQRAQSWRTAAADRLFEAANLAALGDERRAALLWGAAEQYDQAGMPADAAGALTTFVDEVSDDVRLPRALLLLGRACELKGDLEAGLRWYRRLRAEYPRLTEAAAARVRAADCLMALGAARLDEAEQTLRELLDDGTVAPHAAVFRDALFSLCNLLCERGRYADAIGRLEEFERLYPGDERSDRVHFLLAESYRRSARDLRAQPPAGADPAQVAELSRQRYRRAAELYAQFLADSAAADADDDRAVYARLALFHRGDCLMALNDADSLREALAVYQEASARYEHEPAALNAQVQIANIYLRMGRPIDAARAIERGRWLLQHIPDVALTTEEEGLGRGEWDRFLTAMATAYVFHATQAANEPPREPGARGDGV